MNTTILKNAFYTNFIALAEKTANIDQNLKELTGTVQKYINIILGSIAGILALVIGIITAIAFFKAGKTDNEEQRQAQLKKIKWIGIFLLAVIIIWAIEGSIVAIFQSVLNSGS